MADTNIEIYTDLGWMRPGDILPGTGIVGPDLGTKAPQLKALDGTSAERPFVRRQPYNENLTHALMALHSPGLDRRPSLGNVIEYQWIDRERVKAIVYAILGADGLTIVDSNCIGIEVQFDPNIVDPTTAEGSAEWMTQVHHSVDFSRTILHAYDALLKPTGPGSDYAFLPTYLADAIQAHAAIVGISVGNRSLGQGENVVKFSKQALNRAKATGDALDVLQRCGLGKAIARSNGIPMYLVL
jgi:hypothetical protein